MSWKDNYQKWANYSDLDLDLKDTIKQVAEKIEKINKGARRVKEFADRLNNKILSELILKGMRGILGAGTNRMNIYMVRKASLGFARYLNTKEGEKSIVIAHDNRYQSVEFAKAICTDAVGKATAPTAAAVTAAAMTLFFC